MLRNLFGGEDPVTTATREEARTERRAAAIAEDTAPMRAAFAAGRGSRSIGVTRRPAES